MEFYSSTPFDSMAYVAEDVEGNEYHVVVMRVGYRLEAIPAGEAAEGDQAPTHRYRLLEGEEAVRRTVWPDAMSTRAGLSAERRSPPISSRSRRK